VPAASRPPYQWPLTTGNLGDASPCALELYIDVADHDVLPCDGFDTGVGPAGSATSNQPCPLDATVATVATIRARSPAPGPGWSRCRPG